MKNIDAVIKNFERYANDDERLKDVIKIHLGLLLKWQKIVNLIGLTSEVEISEFLYLDSYLALKSVSEFLYEKKIDVNEISDIGSGAGFPSIFWFYFLSEVRVVLFESKRKKANFLMEFIREAGLKNYEVKEEMVKREMLRTDLIISKAAININDWTRFGISNVKKNGVVVSLLSKPSSEIYNKVLEKTPRVLESHIREYKLPNTDTIRQVGIIIKK